MRICNKILLHYVGEKMRKQKISKVYNTLLHWREFRLQLFIEGVLIGILAGMIVSLFRFLLEQAEIFRRIIYNYLSAETWKYTLLWFIVLLFIAYLLNQIVKKEPMASGSGIPQVEGAILGLVKLSWLSVLLHKFVGGVLAIGSGLSLGREGPSIQLGAMIGQGISRLLGRTRMEERYLLTSGASAGLAAAFNAPLAGIIFSLEEIHKNFSSTVLVSSVAAALTADVIAQQFFGYEPVFHFTGLPILPLKYYGYIVALGIIIGLAGTCFNRCLLKTLKVYSKQSIIKGTGKIALPLFLAGVMGFVLPDILGGGNALVNTLAETNYSFTLLAVLLIGKFVFTMISYGSGVPGGIFLPMLVIGALAGDLFGQAAIQFFGLDPIFRTNLIVLSMAAYFSAVVKAPITGSILIMEMTGSFSHMLSLIIISMTAYIVADLVKSKPIYEALLQRSLSNSKNRNVPVAEPQRMVIEVVIAINSTLNGKKIKDVSWPTQALLVSIKRGTSEVTPKGNIRILAGDFLYIIANDEQATLIRELAASNH